MGAAQQQRNEKQLRELRAVVNHAESLVREKQNALEDALHGLEDSEALFDRAIRIRHQQDEICPCFRFCREKKYRQIAAWIYSSAR